MVDMPEKTSGWNAGNPPSSSDKILGIQNGANVLFPARKAPRVVTVNGAAYTLILTDADTYLRLIDGTDATALCGVDIPANADVAFPVGTSISIEAKGTGGVVFNGAAGVTINPDNPCYILYKGGVAVATKVDTDEWTIAGAQVG